MKTIRSLVETYYDVQNMRIEVDNQIRAYAQGVSKQEITFIKESVSQPLTNIEDDIKKYINKSLKKDPVTTELYEYLSGIKGIGPMLSGGLIAWIEDIERFATISKLWAYCGVAGGYVKSECAKGHKIISTSMPVTCPIFKSRPVNPLDPDLIPDVKKKEAEGKCGAKMTLLEKHEGEVARRQVGWFILQNTRLKTHIWKIGESFVKTKGGYRELYDQFRVEYNEKWQTPADCKSKGCAKYKKCLDGHKYMAAKRKTTKVFLAHLHMKWREIKGLPIDHPFIIGREGHSHLIPIVYE